MKRINPVFCLLAAILWFAAPTQVFAQAFPSRPITIVVPFPPGGVTDQTSRLVGQKISESTGQTVIIDNRPGAGGQIGANVVKQARPDGYTLFVANIGSHAINQTLYNKLSYDPIKDFDPITCMIITPQIVVVPPASPNKSIAELIAYAKANPGKVTYASQSVGSGGHIAGEVFKSKDNLDILHVPYKGSAPALTDIMAGRVDFLVDAFLTAYPLIKDGRIRALAITADRRSPLLPDLPTMQELGYNGYDVIPWFGIAAPAGTPRPIIEKLHAEFVKALRHPDIVKRLAEVGVDVVANTPEEFAAMIKSETARWGEVVKASGARVD